MKVPWSAAFEDGDERVFLEEFEDVAELAGIRTDRDKSTALRALLKGCARAVLDAARTGPEKMEWAAAKDRQKALRRFKTAQLGVGVDPLSHAVALRGLLDRALPTLDESAHSELLLDRFTESLPKDIRGKAKLINVARTMGVMTLAEVFCQGGRYHGFRLLCHVFLVWSSGKFCGVAEDIL
ncbi:unnamed protein product [Echinostoma caproni]|uniref:DUF4158 domain-containing protein n=1 Tax=Echinostoma caproni TaxID=27848 RepID=A0A183ABM6_9TREM|nr:unnamed protein product [Echinostoma caproni]